VTNRTASAWRMAAMSLSAPGIPPPVSRSSVSSNGSTAPALTNKAEGSEIRGSSVVEAWIDEYIRFEHRTAEQERLRGDPRSCGNLKAPAGHVLHATFVGDKPHAADVENLVIYDIDDTGRSFARAAAFGLRFELGQRGPTSPTGNEYRYGYRYEVAPLSAGFRYWRERRELASWAWVDLGAFSGHKKLEQVWLAFAGAGVGVASPGRAPGTPFAICATIRPPRSATPVLGGLIKGIFDGVASAFQAHTDTADIAELAARASRNATASPAEIEALLLCQRQAVLGAVPRLLHRRGKRVQWAPADDLCIAGELLAEQPTDSAWSIKGKIVESQIRLSAGPAFVS
jgi:hypothetical protein